jgi:CubicO group peptidase (beta-lactamase class C family)
MGRLSSVFATAIALCVLAQAAMPARADTGVALTPALSARIDQMAKAQIHAGRTPGLAIGIVEDGRIVYARGFGFADLNKHVPMTRTRSSTPAASPGSLPPPPILLLAQDGKLALDDHVSKYVPEFHSGATGSRSRSCWRKPPAFRLPRRFRAFPPIGRIRSSSRIFSRRSIK